ncbi:MAG: MlaD family protein, partial [Bdellovibrionales bacterium]
MKVETKVGILSLVGVISVLIFAYWIGVLSPIGGDVELKIMYNYAGGIEVGSPVRVMGIKVGKVKSIDFYSDYKTESGEEVKLQVTIVVSQKSWNSIRSDSKFFINLAGVI